MKVLIIPKITEPYKDQLEVSIETKLIYFLHKCFKNCLIDIAYKFEIKNNYNLIILSGGNSILKYSNSGISLSVIYPFLIASSLYTCFMDAIV